MFASMLLMATIAYGILWLSQVYILHDQLQVIDMNHQNITRNVHSITNKYNNVIQLLQIHHRRDINMITQNYESQLNDVHLKHEMEMNNLYMILNIHNISING